ncbi:hypothetical protein AX15_004880 [Amanita polypyramis BW_CC]|nr:hypothetical protein AX15_004880 [Amanita polypyramis BW_CC]
MNTLNLSEVEYSHQPYSAEDEIAIRQSLVIAKQKGSNGDRYGVAPTPHTKLVEDVLRIIFVFACNGGELLQPGIAASMAVVISHVSSLWRQIILDMPQMWVYVCLEILRGPVCVFDDYVEKDLAKDKQRVMLAEMWLDRGGSLPRTLTVNAASRSACQHYFPDLAQRLVKQYPFNRLTLYLFWDQIGSLPYTPMTTLECLSVRVDESSEAINSSISQDTAAKMPLSLLLPTEMTNLTELVLDGPTAAQWDIHTLTTIVPWRNMTHVELGIVVPSTMVFSVILRQGASLRYCYVLMSEDGALAGELTSDPLVLTKMECLILYCATNQDVEVFEQWVATPNTHHRRIDTRPREYRAENQQ